jgi:hypothetical protein
MEGDNYSSDWGAWVSVTFSGQPLATTYKSGDANVTGDAQAIVRLGNAYWMATTGQPSRGEVGSISVTLSDPGNLTLDSAGSKVFASHGSFHVTLAPQTGSSDPVIFDGSF